MGFKKPWKVGPSGGARQAYVTRDAEGRPIVRQSLTYDGRVLHFDMTPDECAGLLRDLENARMDTVADNWADGASPYPDARF